MTNELMHILSEVAAIDFVTLISSFVIFTPAYRPFLEPLPIDDYWMWLVIPLVVAICIVYKTIKDDDLRKLPRQAASLSVQVLIFMALAATALWLVTELV